MRHAARPRLVPPGHAITQQRRLGLLRRFATGTSIAIRPRAAACVLLLYAQPLSRILHLTAGDLVRDDDGQPASYRGMLTQLRDLGLPMRTARIAALRQLVLAVPAPVIAGALGFHHTTTTRQHIKAGATWSQYAANRDRD